MAISPLDSRYRELLTDIPRDVDRLEYQLNIEYLWACHFANALNYKLTNLKPFVFNDELVHTVRRIESLTKHDVKAIELTVANTFFSERDRWLVHLGLTSEDINGFGNAHLLKKSNNVVLGDLEKIINSFKELSENLNQLIPARTHGQLAIPTTFGDRFKVYIAELIDHWEKLNTKFSVKFGGSIGNFDELRSVLELMENAPDLDDMVKSFSPFNLFEREKYTFQTSLYTHLADYLNKLGVLCSFLIKICWDLWDAFSRGYFTLVIDGKRVGSSVMTQKVNPANTENAIGNFRVARMWATEMARDLPEFRLERDITDSTMLRNIPVLFGHLVLGMRMMMKDINDLKPTQFLDSEQEVRDNGQIYGARLQTYMRLKRIPDAYEKLRAVTQNSRLTREEIFKVMKPHFQENPAHLLKLLDMEYRIYTLNTSNRNKRAEFSRLFTDNAAHVDFTDHDFEEPQANQETIVQYKATQAYNMFNKNVIVEDSALYVSGYEEATGVNIKWVLDHLDEYNDRKATFCVIMGYFDGTNVHMSRASVDGTIRKAEITDNTFGFDNHFIPDGSSLPYSVHKPDNLNPRAIVVKRLLAKEERIFDPIFKWEGEFQ